MKPQEFTRYRAVLETVPLFAGIDAADLPAMLACLGAQVKVRRKGEYILREGEKAERVGIVLAGKVQVLREDYFGRRSILAELCPGELFAETFACARVARMPVSVQASQNCAVLLFDYAAVVEGRREACGFHTILTANMLAVLAGKNLALNAKMDTLAKRSTREKLLAYLYAQAKQANKRKFTIPFNRQELADYLSVDRSALSSELSRMQKEGLLVYHKNDFELGEVSAYQNTENRST